MISIYTNQAHYFSEKRYIIDTIFSDFLGLAYELKHHDSPMTEVVINDQTVSIPDMFFNVSCQEWPAKKALPASPCPVWHCRNHSFSHKLTSSALPILFGVGGSQDDYLTIEKNKISIHFDLLGGCFFMLSGYEEFLSQAKDTHDRFPHTASHAYANQYLERPLVNEYLEVLWFCLQHISPDLSKKHRQYQVRVSHDVDTPFRYAFSGWKNVAKEMLKSLKTLSLARSVSQPLNYLCVKYYRKVEKDPYFTFPFLMDMAEKHGLRLWFYFLADNTDPMNADYDIKHPFIKNLLSEIHHRGHYIGLHGSYHTYHRQDRLANELDKLKSTCAELGIKQEEWGNRQHFLRWHNPGTVRGLSHAGFTHDSTLGFPAHAGFKAGTCYAFFLYDLERRQVTSVREYPLITMEATLLGYMQLDHRTAFEKINHYAQCCRQFDGNFTLLWHNSSLDAPHLLNVYSNILSSVTAGEYCLMSTHTGSG